MLFLVSLVIALLFSFLCDKILKKHPIPFYIAASVVTVAVIVISQMSSNGDIVISSPFVKNYVLGIFSRGALAAALWAVVMYAGALPNGSAPIKKLMPIRGELSIFAAAVTLSHIVTYGMKYINSLINKRTGTDSALVQFTATSIISLVMVLIMLPLTVISFKAIRKKINPKKWKNIQRFAYIFYALIYAHIMVLFVPKAKLGQEGYMFSIIVYTLVFAVYAAMRIRKWYIAKKKPESKAAINSICTVAAAAVLTGAVCISLKSQTAAEPQRGKRRERPQITESQQTTEAQKEESTDTATTAVVSGTALKSDTTAVSGSEGTAAASSSAQTATESVTASATEAAEEENEQNDTQSESENKSDDKEEENNSAPEPEKKEEAAPTPEPVQENHIYKDGVYEASAYGYDGDVSVKITIENDKVVSIEASSAEEDLSYFNSAKDAVIRSIISAQDTYVDAVSGATYSSNAIMEAVEKAMESAKN
ncbi:MAG TPA: FMN-binding protein [Ruminococcus flavefaciens]|nr:FMN-binding protein [Ruminococcus flavefaciens]